MNARRVLRIAKSDYCAAAYRWLKWFTLTAVVASAAPLYGQGQSQPARAKATSIQNDALRLELLAMTKVDQAARIELMQELKEQGVHIGQKIDVSNPKAMSVMAKVTAELSAVDGKNRNRLKEIVDQHGWPGKSMVGKDGAQAAWLLAQHADSDIAFQKKCLKLMQALPEGEIAKQSVAYLTDRVLVAEKKPQRYGTQMDGEFQPKPLEDPENVDARRAKVGLPPLAEYIQMAREGYEILSKSPPETEETRVPTDATVSAVTGNHLQGGKHGNEHARFFRSLRGRPGASRAAVRLCATRRR